MAHKIRKHDQELMKKINKGLILNLIREKKPISRSDLAKLTNMSPTSVSRIVAELSDAGLIIETAPGTNKIGRKALLLDTAPNSIYILCAQLDQDVSRVGIVDFDGNIIRENDVVCDVHAMTWTELSDKICHELENVIDDAGIDGTKIIGLGIGIPGLIDTNNGVVLSSPQLQWKNVPLVKYIESRLPYSVTIDNIIKLKALAETYYGSAKNKNNVVFVHFGTGVGSTLISDGKVYRGVTNTAGEIGHTTIDPNGKLCDCGRRGCLQTFITDSALLEEARKIKNVACVDGIFEAASQGEEWAVAILDNLYTYIAITVCNIVCMYNPNTVILGGKLTEYTPETEQIIKDKIEGLMWAQLQGSYDIKLSSLGEHAGLLGMAIWMVNRYIDIEL